VPTPTLIPDDYPDPVDRHRMVDLGDVGLPGYCATVTVGRDGEEHMILARYNAGECGYRPEDWTLVAPHEVPGLWPGRSAGTGGP
jgi:hypothetical protein